MKVVKCLRNCLSVMVCASLLAACSNNEGSSAMPTATPITDEEAITATITIQTTLDYGDWLKDTLNEFEELHTKWDLTFDTQVIDENTLLTEGEENTADVYIYPNDLIDELADAGKIAELGGETLSSTKEENAQSVMNSLLYNSQMYAVPIEVDTWFVYYDTSVFEEDDLKNLTSMLKKGKVGIPLTNGEYLTSFYLANGCTIFGSGDNLQVGVNFSGDNAQAVTEYLVSLVKNKNFVNIEDDAADQLTEGNVNAVFASSTQYKEIAEALGENTGVMAAPVYRLSGQDKQLQALVTSVVGSVNPSSENLKVAVALIGYLSSQYAQLSLYEANGNIPFSLLNEDDDMYIKAMKETLQNASFARPIFSQMDTVIEAASSMGSELIHSSVTKDNASEKTESMNSSMNMVPQAE